MCVLRLLLHVAAAQLLWSSSDAATRSTTLLDHHARARSHHSRQWNCLGLRVFVATWFLCNLTTTCKHLNESELGNFFWPIFLRITQTKPFGLTFDLVQDDTFDMPSNCIWKLKTLRGLLRSGWKRRVLEPNPAMAESSLELTIL